MRATVLRESPTSDVDLMFLHGFLGAPEAFAEVAAGLPANVRVRGAVLPGHGFAPAYVEGAEALWASVPRPEQSARLRVLVGYSMGGRIALGAAIAAPAAWDVVVAIGAHDGLEGAARNERRAEDEARAERVLTVGVERFVDGWESEPLFSSQRSLSESIWTAQRRMRVAHTEHGIAWSLRNLSAGTLPKVDVRKTKARLVFVAGARDAAYVEHAARMARLSGSQPAHVVEGAAHNVVLEAPSAVIEILLSAIRGPWP